MARFNEDESPFPLKRVLTIGSIAVITLFFLIFSGKLVENMDNKEIMVVQNPFSGALSVYSGQGGMKWQGFGTVTKYRKSFQYWFDGKEHEGYSNVGSPIPIKFYDGGHAAIPGSVRVDLPLDVPSIIKIHTKYGSQEALENQLVSQVLVKAVYMAGPTMTSKESYAEKKTDLLYYVEDQASHGVYKTTQKDIKVLDPLTGQERVATVVEILKDTTGLPIRLEQSLVAEMSVKLNNLSFGDFAYDETVKAQIATQQKALMQVQTAMARAKEAEQQAITAEQQGKANATEAKWAQETENATIVAEADGRKRAAEQDALAAEQEKKANILRGQGESEYKRLVTQANNNFDGKKEAYIEVNKAWATAFANYKGNIVPQVQTGGGDRSSGDNGFRMAMEAVGIKAMKDLGTDMQPK